MDSKQVKAAFKAAGISVRVADLGAKFRICRMGEVAHDLAASAAVAAALGLTDTAGRPGGQLNQQHELLGYKPGQAARLFGIAAPRPRPNGWRVLRPVFVRAPGKLPQRTWEPEPGLPAFDTPAAARRSYMERLDPRLKGASDEFIKRHFDAWSRNTKGAKLQRSA